MEDKEILDGLEWGVPDYSHATPPVCTFISAQALALNQHNTFAAEFKNEIAKGWIGSPSPKPKTIPFIVVPGRLVPKKARSKFRQASAPRQDAKEGIVTIGEQPPKPISPNFNTVLSPALRFEWASIGSLGDALNILAHAATKINTPIRGRTVNLQSCFRKIPPPPLPPPPPLASTEKWKAHTYFEERYHSDDRLKMIRASAAHNSQRILLLLTELLRREALAAQEKERTIPKRTSAQKHQRMAATEGKGIPR